MGPVQVKDLHITWALGRRQKCRSYLGNCQSSRWIVEGYGHMVGITWGSSRPRRPTGLGGLPGFPACPDSLSLSLETCSPVLFKYLQVAQGRGEGQGWRLNGGRCGGLRGGAGLPGPRTSCVPPADLSRDSLALQLRPVSTPCGGPISRSLSLQITLLLF